MKMLKIIILAILGGAVLLGGILFIALKNDRALMDNGHQGLRELNYSFEKYLAVSDDEKTIAFNRGTEDLKEYLYTATIDGSNVKLIPNSGGGSNPAFSKDNKKLAFITKKGDSYGDQEQIESIINIINLTDNSLEQSIPLKGYNIWEVAFSPDDSGLYFINTQKMTNIFSSSFKNPSDYDIYYLSFKDQTPLNKTQFKKEGDLQNPSIKNLQVEKDGTIRFAMSKDLHSDSIYEIKGSLGELYHSTGYIFNSNVSTDGSMLVIDEPTKEDKFEYTFNLHSLGTGEKRILIDKDPAISSPRFLNSEKKIIFFLQQDESGPSSAAERSKIRAIDQGKNYQLTTINFDGSDLKNIDLQIP